MRVECFEDRDTLQIAFDEGTVVDTRDLDENTLIETDARGRLVSITVEHARERTDLPASMFKTYPEAVA